VKQPLLFTYLVAHLVALSASTALFAASPRQFPFAVAIARLASALRPVSARPYQRILQRTARRGYASAGNMPKKAASSDMPWSVPRHPS